MRKLYKFYWDCGRMGQLGGTLVEDDYLVKKIIGKTVYFGEVLGKHSEVYGTLKEEDFTVLTDDQGFIDKFIEYKCGSGYDPFFYMEDGWEEEENDEP